MRTFKLTLGLPDGTKVWINPQHILKMEKTPDGTYFLFLVDGEKFLIDHSMARTIENCLEG